MTLPSRHRIRHARPGGLRPSTLPFGHGGFSNIESLRVSREETFCFFETWRPESGSNPRSPSFSTCSFNHCNRTPRWYCPDNKTDSKFNHHALFRLIFSDCQSTFAVTVFNIGNRTRSRPPSERPSVYNECGIRPYLHPIPHIFFPCAIPINQGMDPALVRRLASIAGAGPTATRSRDGDHTASPEYKIFA